MELNRKRTWMAVLVITLLVIVGPVGIASAKAQPGNETIIDYQNNLQFPIRAAYYYPWFPEAWDQSGFDPFTNYEPSQGFYSEDDPKVIANQIEAMQYGKIQVGIASWWGQGHFTDKRFPQLLKAAKGTGFKWVLYMENEGYEDPSISSIRSDLAYIHDHYANLPEYLHINNKFLVFVYGGETENCNMINRWKAANIDGAYLVLKVFPGYKKCKLQPDAWHEYAPLLAQKQIGFDSFVISPGFSKPGDTKTSLGRDPERWNSNIQAMVASRANFQLITTFNEWGEGTAVESAKEWSSPSGFGFYLDALHFDGQKSQTAIDPNPDLNILGLLY